MYTLWWTLQLLWFKLRTFRGSNAAQSDWLTIFYTSWMCKFWGKKKNQNCTLGLQSKCLLWSFLLFFCFLSEGLEPVTETNCSSQSQGALCSCRGFGGGGALSAHICFLYTWSRRAGCRGALSSFESHFRALRTRPSLRPQAPSCSLGLKRSFAEKRTAFVVRQRRTGTSQQWYQESEQMGFASQALWCCPGPSHRRPARNNHAVIKKALFKASKLFVLTL